ncbi:MAG: CSLREA domain-containing protein [Anaerolineae bacterium]|nr:CSLREA domain-containing protein [Anaerolineae bacterium]
MASASFLPLRQFGGPVIVLALLAAASGAIPVRAASITVTTTADELNADGDCSLREAIQAVNTRSPMDACPAGTGDDLIVLSGRRGHPELGGAGAAPRRPRRFSGTSASAVGGGLCIGCGPGTGRGVLEQAILRRNAADRGGGIFSNRPLTSRPPASSATPRGRAGRF